MKVILNGTEYTVRQLSVRELTDDVFAFVKSQSIKDAHEMAQGLSAAEKTAFLKSAWQNLPTKAEVLSGIDKWIATFDGIQYIINKSVTPKLEIDVKKMEEYIPIIHFALGIEYKEENEVKGDSKEANFLLSS